MRGGEEEGEGEKKAGNGSAGWVFFILLHILAVRHCLDNYQGLAYL